MLPRTKTGTCALCKEEQVELQMSHIIPKGVYRRAKSFNNSRFRKYNDPKIEYQDGEKKHLLCHDCEEFFSGYETIFDNRFLDVYLKSPKSKLPNLDNETEFYLITVSWRILYDDLYNYSSFSNTDQEIIMKEYEQKLWRYILEKYREKHPEKKLSKTEYIPVDLNGKSFGEIIAETEKLEKSKQPEDMSEIQNHVFSLPELGFSRDVKNLLDSFVIGYSFYDATQTKFYIVSLYKGLVLTTAYHRKRCLFIPNSFLKIKRVKKTRRIIVDDIRNEVSFLLHTIAQQYDETQKKLDETGLRGRIEKRYKSKRE